MKVVFMGTPEFAAHILDRIIQAGHNVVSVVTTPDKPAGRGQHIKYSDVKNYALEHNLPLLQPEKMKDKTFVKQLQDLDADVFVVVAFRMLPSVVYTIPPKGTFNVHASLLPQYRGAAPIQWSIINGETKSGVTTFFLDEHTDTGAIIRQTEVEITREDNVGTLHDKLMFAGAEIAVDTLNDIETGNLSTRPQTTTEILKPAPKIFKEDMKINWDDSAENIYNKIRGLSPYPAAFTTINNVDEQGNDTRKANSIKIFESSITSAKSTEKPGTITIKGNKTMLISTKTFDISIKSLQFEGKKRMDVEIFLAGFRISNYTKTLF
ncbi:MAG: methionyl-tRNA formyltransferase [Bacteroidales bacterium]|nr:methionyl-tRNA formyltransferase [Bacteroidales bacterium]